MQKADLSETKKIQDKQKGNTLFGIFIAKDLEEMKAKIEEYQQEIKTEEVKRDLKGKKIKKFVQESKELFEMNQKIEKEVDNLETRKEDSKYLIHRENQDKGIF